MLVLSLKENDKIKIGEEILSIEDISSKYVSILYKGLYFTLKRLEEEEIDKGTTAVYLRQKFNEASMGFSSPNRISRCGRDRSKMG